MKSEQLYNQYCLETPLVGKSRGLEYINWLENRIIKLETQLEIRELNTLDKIILSICIKNDISVDLFLSNKKYRYLTEARAAYCFIAKENTNKTLLEIGQKINRNHATVIHHLRVMHPSVKEIIKYIDNNYDFSELKLESNLTYDQKILIRAKSR